MQVKKWDIILLAIAIFVVSMMTKENHKLKQNNQLLNNEIIELYEQLSQLQLSNQELEEKYHNTKQHIVDLKESHKRELDKVSRSSNRGRQFLATAYVDNVESQGQWVGTTATGFKLTGHTRESAMCIAVDPNVIPLYSKVKLTFAGEMAKYNGTYTAYDTGGAIKGNRIDVFFGDASQRSEAYAFGRRDVSVEILE